MLNETFVFSSDFIMNPDRRYCNKFRRHCNFGQFAQFFPVSSDAEDCVFLLSLDHDTEILSLVKVPCTNLIVPLFIF